MISLNNISKYYYSQNSVALGLRKINLEFQTGEFIAITGESGSGKSTLLNVISGMDTYEDGEMYVDGEPTSYYGNEDWETYRRSYISVVYQSYNLIDSYTALENIESLLLICEINGKALTDKERRLKAMECLKKVGLEKQAKQRATHLSSGQKQRLAIARALAKDTPVLIADEPTGNLDSDNGIKIMQLLHQLSADKLVIVVTHNYDQAEPYVTRKIRLYDGEVAEDIALRPAKYKKSEDDVKTLEQDTVQTVKKGKQKTKSSLKASFKLLRMNKMAQPKRNLFISAYIFVAVCAAFIFFGTLKANLDDTSTKVIKSDAFQNLDSTRLIIRRFDGKNLTSSDIKKISAVKYVDGVDQYDSANDINYFYKKNQDYRISYTTAGDETLSNKVNITFDDFSHFVRSSTCISSDDLSKGRLPSAYNEIALYSNDESMLGKSIDFYFNNKKLMLQTGYAKVTVTVVGLLKENTDQVYFSEGLAKSLSVDYTQYTSKITYSTIKKIVYDDTTKPDDLIQSDKAEDAIFIVNPELSGMTAKISQEYYLNLDLTPVKMSNCTKSDSMSDQAKITLKGPDTGEEGVTIDVTLITEGSKSSGEVVEVSQELFDKIYTKIDATQATVYMDDYAYTDVVKQKIESLDYEVLSVYRTSAGDYDPDKTQARFVTLGIALGGLVVMFFLDILVIYIMMKLKRADFIIFESLGMTHTTVRQINYMDLISSTILAGIVTFVAAILLSRYGIKEVYDLVKYYRPSDYLAVLLYGICMAVGTARFYNGYLLKRFRITSLKGE